MKRAIIFANGKIDEPPPIIKDLHPGDLLIAADGGSQHCKAFGFVPNAIIGDFDSVNSEELTILMAKGVETIRHPRQKDETDLELAIKLAIDRGASEIYILGALGNRWDMTLSNLLLLALPAFSSVKIRVVDGRQVIFIMHSQEEVTLQGTPGDTISLIPLAGDGIGINTQGLEYPLKEETLYFGSSRGVSNVFTGEKAQIELKHGSLLCILNQAAVS